MIRPQWFPCIPGSHMGRHITEATSHRRGPFPHRWLKTRNLIPVAHTNTHLTPPTQAREWERDKAELSLRPQWESICVQYWLVFDPCHSLLSSVSPQAPYWPSLTVCLHTHTHSHRHIHTHTHSHNLNWSSASCHERDNLDGDGVRHRGGVRGRKK